MAYSKTIQNDYDVIVVGAGLAGMTLTCLLAQNDVRVLCVDRVSFDDLKHADERTTAISYGSSQILDRAGIWGGMNGRTCAIKDIDILDGSSPSLLSFASDETDYDAFGWIVDNRDLRMAMKARIDDLAFADMMTPAVIQDFSVSNDGASIVLDDGQTLSAQLIVGADGRKSAVRDFMDLSVRYIDYKQRAIVCIVSHECPHNNIAVEHFRASGPLAILPMHDDTDGRHRSSIVLTEDYSAKHSFADMDDAAFTMLLNTLFPERYGDVVLAGRRLTYPLVLNHAYDYIAPRMVLVSDAAHGMHPIAGQGLNVGLRDVRMLSDLVVDALSDGRDVGDFVLLETYQRKRRPDVVAMLGMTDGLNRLFSNDHVPLKVVRKLGLRAVNRFPAAKRFFVLKAMGL